jgi:hypothetical protein
LQFSSIDILKLEKILSLNPLAPNGLPLPLQGNAIQVNMRIAQIQFFILGEIPLGEAPASGYAVRQSEDNLFRLFGRKGNAMNFQNLPSLSNPGLEG